MRREGFSTHLPPARSSAGRSPSRSAARGSATVARRSKDKPRLKLRVGEADGGLAVAKPAARGKHRKKPSARGKRAASSAPTKVEIRLADVDGSSSGGRSRKSRPGRDAGTAAVQTVEIRPSGTVISRRQVAKRPAILHLPLHPTTPLKPPAWMLEECHVAPARAGDQNEILQLLAGLPAPPSRAEFHAAVDHPEIGRAHV